MKFVITYTRQREVKREIFGSIAEGASCSQGEAGWAGPVVASQPEVTCCQPQREQRMLKQKELWGAASHGIQSTEKTQ